MTALFAKGEGLTLQGPEMSECCPSCSRLQNAGTQSYFVGNRKDLEVLQSTKSVQAGS